MSNNTRLYFALPVLLVLFLLPRGCDAVTAITHKAPEGCQQAAFSPESAPVGSHFFGDGSSNMQLPAEDMKAAFKQSAACDPFQISVREMAWGLQPIPDEAARFKRQQQLAGDLGLLTEASKRINQIVDSSTFTVDTNWSGQYETLFAAATQDGWHAYKLRKSMLNETVLVQKTAGNRVFIWKVKCLWQPVARILQGYPVGPPQGTLPPGKKPPKPTPTTPPPPGTHPTVPPTVPPTNPPGCTHNCTPPTTRPPGCTHNCTPPPPPPPGKDPSDGIGNDPGAAGQGDTGPRPGGPTPANPPVDTQPPATYGTVPSQTTLPPPVTSPSQPPVTNTIPTPDTAPD